jgi:hypothetical protein
MKKTFTLFVLLFCTLSGFAVANESRLSISYLSNSNYSIMVDGRFQANISNGHEDFFRIVQPGYHRINTNVIYIICQYFINLTVVNADGIKQIVQ